MKILHSPRLIGGLLGIIISTALIAWTFWYFPAVSETFELNSLNAELAAGYSAKQAPYWITVSWTPRIQIGNQGFVWIRVEPKPVDPAEQTAAIQDANLCKGSPQVRLCGYNLLTEARVDLPGMDVTPAGSVSKNLQGSQKLEFAWNTHSDRAEMVTGTIWLFLDEVPKGKGETIRMPLLAKHVTITSSDLLGMDVSFWRFLGGAGVLCGVVLLMLGKKKTDYMLK
jgi:hypothetical protein